MGKTIEELIAEQGIRLDIGCGGNKQKGFIGIDILPLPGVDIVHNIELIPWPLPDECVSIAMASHLLEHISPAPDSARADALIKLLVSKGVITQEESDKQLGRPGPPFLNVMNEVWRIMKTGGQFAFVVPYAESFGMFQDPTHCNFINESTMAYFDPLHPSGLYGFYHPKPWKIIQQPFSRQGVLEVLLEKRAMDKSYRGIGNPSDLTQEKFDVEIIRTNK